VALVAGTPRTQQKQANRRAMTEAATRLFASAGYAGTTMEAVARESGMSVQGVYFAFQTKANLLEAAHEAALPTRPSMPASTDPDQALRLLVEDACEVLDRTGALEIAVGSAALGDSAAAEVHQRLEERRSRQAAALVQRLRALRPLAPGVTVRRASDVVFALLSPQLHAVLVRDRGWSTKRYAGWTAEAVGRALWD
jgi:AcrR family transcriptional regulator